MEQAGHLGYLRALADPRYDPARGSVETWAFRGAIHAVYAVYRSERCHRGRVERYRERARTTAKGSPHGLDQLDRLAVRDAVEGLPEAERELIVAWFWEGETPKEYAHSRGMGEWAAYRIRDRALSHLARAIGG